jgi:magnesium-protoporphyrin O-methyltransferase
LIGLARERSPRALGAGRVDFLVGDMLDPALGRFDHVVAMDSLIHYRAPDAVQAVAGLAARAEASLLFTFAPRTAPLALMHAVGRLFPRGDRAPAVGPAALRQRLGAEPALRDWFAGRGGRTATGFYISEALELVRR